MSVIDRGSFSDNGPCYISKELKIYLEEQGMKHSRGAPYHPITKRKIERYHRTMKIMITLDHYYFHGELDREITGFVDLYNNQRLYESLDNLTPVDVYEGRDK